MSRFTNLSKSKTSLSAIANQFEADIASQGSEFIAPENADAVIASVESLSSDVIARHENNFGEVQSNIVESLTNLDEDTNFTKDSIGVEAATIVAMGLGNPSAYHEKATQSTVSSEGVTVIGDNMGVPAMEAFDQGNIGNFKAYSLAFNLESAQQDEFGETLFPTIVLTPEVGGLDVTIEQTVVHREVRRALGGDVTDFNKRKVLDAVVDHTILESETTRIYPIVLDNGTNAKYFTDNSVVAKQTLSVDGVDITTAPLKPGMAVDLLGLSSGSPLNNGQELTDEDSIDSNASLDVIYVKVTDAAASKSSVIAISVNGLPRTSFYKSPEGKSDREMSIQFSNETVVLQSTRNDIAGVPAEGLATLLDNKLNLSINMSGTLDIETGSLNVYSPTPAANALYAIDGQTISISAGTGKSIVDNLTFELVGYTLEAYHSNANLRHRGILGSHVGKVERYSIGFNAPITAKAPIGDSEKRKGTDLRTITAISRTRNANEAVTKLLERAGTLKQYAEAVVGDMPVPEIEGAGRHLVSPYYKDLTIDMEAVINSTKSHEKAADVADTLINAIRALAYPMAQDSNYQTALETITNGRETKPRLVIATDSVLQRHIMVSGDERTASIGMDHKVVTSPDNRMTNEIFLTFAREGVAGEADPLSFGAHGWIPEMVSSANVSRGGSTATVTTVQTRNRHIGLLPVMARITVTNLDKVLSEKV
jgi:hypothetical protein